MAGVFLALSGLAATEEAERSACRHGVAQALHQTDERVSRILKPHERQRQMYENAGGGTCQEPECWCEKDESKYDKQPPFGPRDREIEGRTPNKDRDACHRTSCGVRNLIFHRRFVANVCGRASCVAAAARAPALRV